MSLDADAVHLIREANKWKNLEYVGGNAYEGNFGSEVIRIEIDCREVFIRDTDLDMKKSFQFNSVNFPKFLAELRLDE